MNLEQTGHGLAGCRASLKTAQALTYDGRGLPGDKSTAWRRPEIAVGLVTLCLALTGCDEKRRTANSRPPTTGDSQSSVQRPEFSGCTQAGDFFRHGRRDDREVALTFDDGPSMTTLPLARVLRRHHAKATFFVVGVQIGDHAEILRRLLAGGFELGNHSYGHGDMVAAGARATKDVRKANRAIRAATGFAPCLFRAPYGKVDPKLIRKITAAGMTTIGWDVDPEDWRRPGAAIISERVISAVRRGSIIVMHDGPESRGQTLSALPAILVELKRRHYKTVTVTELLGGTMEKTR